MTEEEFLKQMENLEIDPFWYNIGGPVRDFCSNLLKIAEDEYTVFYQEKGDIIDTQIFFTYEEALDYLFKVLKTAYPTNKKDNHNGDDK